MSKLITNCCIIFFNVKIFKNALRPLKFLQRYNSFFIKKICMLFLHDPLLSEPDNLTVSLKFTPRYTPLPWQPRKHKYKQVCKSESCFFINTILQLARWPTVVCCISVDSSSKDQRHAAGQWRQLNIL